MTQSTEKELTFGQQVVDACSDASHPLLLVRCRGSVHDERFGGTDNLPAIP